MGHGEMHQTLVSGRRGLECNDVHVAIGERPAKFAECARPVFHVDAELLGGWHDRLPPVVLMRNAVARSCGIGSRQKQSYSGCASVSSGRCAETECLLWFSWPISLFSVAPLSRHTSVAVLRYPSFF